MAHPTENDDEINKRATNIYEAMIFLMRADKSKYEHLWNDLRIICRKVTIDTLMTYPPLVIFYTITLCQIVTIIRTTHKLFYHR